MGDWEPKFDQYNAEYPDKAISWAHKNDMRIRAHCLFWAVNDTIHYPDWVYPLRGGEMKDAIDHRLETAMTYYEVENVLILA